MTVKLKRTTSLSIYIYERGLKIFHALFQMGRQQNRRQIQPSFFKVLIGDFSKRLLIPPEFIKHFNPKLPGTFILRSPNGKCWPVRVKMFKDSWFFQRGWRQFVRYHSLEPAEFLVFRYNGDSKFRVTIYDTSACEKEMPSSPKRRKSCEKNPHTQKEKPISHSDHEDEPISQILKEVHEKKSFKSSKKEGVVTGKMTSEYSGLKKKKRRRIPANKIERNGGLEAVRLLRTKHAHFTQIIRRHKDLRITVPRALAVKNGFTDNEMAELQDPQGRWWEVKISQGRDGRILLKNGLQDFWKRNNLVEGDACVFELIEDGGKKNAMRVHIFRAVEPVPNGSTHNATSDDEAGAPDSPSVQEVFIKS